MYLRSLSLSGFKSFADATSLVFEPGVTVVVGPNGSGKSNVVDGIAWVLGAQGPRTLRGQRMDDVVFAGTESRGALGRAEVTLVIDNESATLPTGTAEVAITRTLFRTGESEYALNGTPCRLLDLQELLSDAGVGRQQHIIVAQGQIEQVLSARPEERRLLIEEAAGVLKFRRRKERAERRLEGTEANVTRLVDLQRELRRGLRPLERQAEAARRHGELVAELDALRLFNAGRRLARLDQAGEAAQARRGEAAAGQQQAADDVDRHEAAMREAQAQLAEMSADGGDRLSRVASLSERARGLVGQTYERLRRVEAERNALVDADVVATLTDEHSRVSAELAELDGADTPSGPSLAQARERSEATAAALAHATENERDVTDELQRWIGRFEALTSAQAATRAVSHMSRLEGIAGVVGELAELIDIDNGWEAAVEAAADGALGAVVVRDDEAAAAALGVLAEAELSGTVISLAGLAPGNGASQPTQPEPHDDLVRQHVRIADASHEVFELAEGIAALLDVLIGDAVRVQGDWREALELALRRSGTTFVTAAGDRFGPRSWRVGISGAAAAAAAVEEARAHIDELTREQSAAGVVRTTAAAEHRAALDAYQQLQRTSEAQRTQRESLTRRHSQLTLRLEGHEAAQSDAAARLSRIEAVVSVLDRMVLLLSERRQRLEAETNRLRDRQGARAAAVRQLTDRIEAHRRERGSATGRLEELRSELGQLDVADAERRTKRDALLDTLRTELETDAEDAESRAMSAAQPPLPEGISADAHERALRSELNRLGPVNPLALSEYEAASERHSFVAEQLDDVRNSRRELNKVIRAIDAEIVATFMGAFDDVARNFAELFGTLFPGGTGRLSLTDANEPLTTGVELDVRPAGKKVGRLSLLSGGERSLVALAYLFAVFRSRPSPFYVLDEVEAALDDVNLQRFLELVAEFRRDSQLVIVSHQRRTMESADVLYGVSMPPGGSSVVVSERPERAAELLT